MGKMNNEWLDLSQQWQEERYEQLMNYYNNEEIVMEIMADEVNEWNIEQAQKHGDWENPCED